MDVSKNWLKLKIFMTKVLTKLGFAAKYDYGDYKRRRNIFLALLIIFSIIIGVVISILAENFKTAQLEKENSQLQNQLQKNAASKEIEISKLNSLLDAKDQKLEEKNNELNEKENKLAGKDKELSKKESQLNLTEQKLGMCGEEIILWKGKDAKSQDKLSQAETSLDACNADKKTLTNTLINFVKAVCCSYDDTSAGRELKWSLQGGKIVCAGEFKINCATGATDYHKWIRINFKFSNKNSKVIVTAEKKAGRILFSVKDFGIGIAKENQARIFEPFFQEEQTMYREYGGTGLGLAICKGIVEAQNGKIRFESEKGKGTTFYFTVPLKPVKVK